jgi:hypothetical protein
MHTKWSEIQKGRDHLEDLGIDEYITSEWIFRKYGCEGVHWIYLAHDRDQW